MTFYNSEALSNPHEKLERRCEWRVYAVGKEMVNLCLDRLISIKLHIELIGKYDRDDINGE